MKCLNCSEETDGEEISIARGETIDDAVDNLLLIFDLKRVGGNDR